MKKYQEVEENFKLLNSDEASEKIEELEAKHSVEIDFQKDIYNNTCHRAFLEHEIVSEWLRIKEADGKCSINIKQRLPLAATIQNLCNANETFISVPAAMYQMLEKLDLERRLAIEKRTNSWLYNNTEVSIDEIQGFG